MANAKLTALTAVTTPASGDKLYLVDVSDTTDSSDGSSRQITLTNLFAQVDDINTDLVTLTGSQTLTNKTIPSPTITTPTITVPTIADFTNAGHDHGDTDDGGAVVSASTTVSGVVELATTAETTTGTNATMAVTPDGLHDMTSLSGAAWMLDEDDMSSNSATLVASQQSIKAYVDSGTVTFTNKRITKRITSITSHATPTINTDNCDVVTITALAEAITSMTTNLSGTPTNFQTLIFRIKDNATARAITWGASFEARGVALPTTTTASKVLTVGFIYDTVTAKWG